MNIAELSVADLEKELAHARELYRRVPNARNVEQCERLYAELTERAVGYGGAAAEPKRSP